MAFKIQTTKDYRLFQRHSNENRCLNMKKHKKLMESMKLYGFLACFPIVVCEDNSVLVIKDGQHRHMIAESLGLPIHYVIVKEDFDIAIVNSAAKTWQLIDYAEKHAANGKNDYREGLDFSQTHGLPIGTAFSLLAGTTSFGNFQAAFIDGNFKVKDRKWAESVASLYGPMSGLSPSLRNARFTEACMAVCRTDGFDLRRMLRCAERCRELLVSYSTKDAYLEMLEKVYNFGQKNLIGLKSLAQMAMRTRNAAVTPPQRKKKSDDSASEATA